MTVLAALLAQSWVRPRSSPVRHWVSYLRSAPSVHGGVETAKSGHECGSVRGVAVPRLAKLRTHLPLFPVRQSHVTRDKDGKHRKCHNVGHCKRDPNMIAMNASVLRVSHIGVGPSRREGSLPLGSKQHAPCTGQKQESRRDDQITRQMNRVQMWIAPKTEVACTEMAEVIAQWINARVSFCQPSRQEVDGQRKSIHLREERDDECGEGPERPPVTPCPRLEKAERKDDEHRRIDDHDCPQPIRRDILCDDS